MRDTQTRFSYVLFLILLATACFGQVQTGQVLRDTCLEDSSFGQFLALSADGTTLAAADVTCRDVGSMKGIVRTYTWRDNGWVSFGNPIVGTGRWDKAGYDLSFSSDGGRLAVATHRTTVKVFEQSGGDWQQIGSTIHNLRGIRTVHAVRLSADGNTLIVANADHSVENAPQVGLIRTFRLMDGEWVEAADRLPGSRNFGQFGYRTDLSADGHTLATVHSNRADEFDRTRTPRAFTLNNGRWEEMILPRPAIADAPLYGWTVDLSADGTTLAVSQLDEEAYESGGHVVVFRRFGDTWAQLGQSIPSGGREDFGLSIQLNATGNRLVVSSPGHPTCAITVYDYIDEYWTPVGDPIGSLDPGFAGTGTTIKLSDDGLSLVTNSSYSGRSVRRYSLQDLTVATQWDCPGVSEHSQDPSPEARRDAEEVIGELLAYPNPTTGLIRLTFGSGTPVEGVYAGGQAATGSAFFHTRTIRVYDQIGRAHPALQIAPDVIDLGGLPAGMYVVRLRDKQTIRVVKK